nr:uncharacterized protein LOC105866071 isoform X2 [Microcebus murinus]
MFGTERRVRNRRTCSVCLRSVKGEPGCVRPLTCDRNRPSAHPRRPRVGLPAPARVSARARCGGAALARKRRKPRHVGFRAGLGNEQAAFLRRLRNILAYYRRRRLPVAIAKYPEAEELPTCCALAKSAGPGSRVASQTASPVGGRTGVGADGASTMSSLSFFQMHVTHEPSSSKTLVSSTFSPSSSSSVCSMWRQRMKIFMAIHFMNTVIIST